MKNRQSIIVIFFALSISVVAQRGPSIISPEIHPDHSVTFRFNARNAKKVMLEAQFLKEQVGS